MKKPKKMFLVSREVFATNVKQAITAKGKIYSIVLAEDKFQPTEEKKVGFNVEKK